MRSKDFVFKSLPSGGLEFVGDFEGLYRNDDDPWQQSGSQGEMSSYYEWSRKRLLKRLSFEKDKSFLEVGCGLGYLTKIISDKFSSTTCHGLDISKTAVEKASKNFPGFTFFQDNICSKNLKISRKYDYILLSQILWYIIDYLPIVLENCNHLLNKNGELIITQGFIKHPQRYAKNIVNGFSGLDTYLMKNMPNSLNISLLDYDARRDFELHDGIIILTKDNNI